MNSRFFPILEISTCRGSRKNCIGCHNSQHSSIILRIVAWSFQAKPVFRQHFISIVCRLPSPSSSAQFLHLSGPLRALPSLIMWESKNFILSHKFILDFMSEISANGPWVIERQLFSFYLNFPSFYYTLEALLLLIQLVFIRTSH